MWNWKPNLHALAHTHTFGRTSIVPTNKFHLNGLANELVLNKLVWRALCACTTLLFFCCFFFFSFHSIHEIHSNFFSALSLSPSIHLSIYLVSISINTKEKESTCVCVCAWACVHLSIRHRFFSMKLDEFCFIVWFDSVEIVMGRSSPFYLRYLFLPRSRTLSDCTNDGECERASEHNRIRFDDYSTFLWFLFSDKKKHKHKA